MKKWRDAASCRLSPSVRSSSPVRSFIRSFTLWNLCTYDEWHSWRQMHIIKSYSGIRLYALFFCCCKLRFFWCWRHGSDAHTHARSSSQSKVLFPIYMKDAGSIIHLVVLFIASWSFYCAVLPPIPHHVTLFCSRNVELSWERAAVLHTAQEQERKKEREVMIDLARRRCHHTTAALIGCGRAGILPHFFFNPCQLILTLMVDGPQCDLFLFFTPRPDPTLSLHRSISNGIRYTITAHGRERHEKELCSYFCLHTM